MRIELYIDDTFIRTNELTETKTKLSELFKTGFRPIIGDTLGFTSNDTDYIIEKLELSDDLRYVKDISIFFDENEDVYILIQVDQDIP